MQLGKRNTMRNACMVRERNLGSLWCDKEGRYSPHFSGYRIAGSIEKPLQIGGFVTVTTVE